MRLFGRQSKDPEQAFWQWFIENSSRLAAVENGREPVWRELDGKLTKVQKGLTFNFGPVVDGRREFIVSADGNKQLFPAVEKLVKAAADIPGWKIITFRPPRSMSKIRMNNIELNDCDVWFSATPRDTLFDLTLYIKGLTPVNMKSLGGVAFIMSDHCIGEYAAETKIGAVDFMPLPVDSEAQGLKELKDLPELIGIEQNQ